MKTIDELKQMTYEELRTEANKANEYWLAVAAYRRVAQFVNESEDKAKEMRDAISEGEN
tara:strand:- start:392 stop:568 length:177 start_codon:yes stop_codon:yes gene_type:complete